MLHPKENNVLYCVQDVVFVFAKLQDGALRSGFSCNFAAIHLLGHPALLVIVSIFALSVQLYMLCWRCRLRRAIRCRLSS